MKILSIRFPRGITTVGCWKIRRESNLKLEISEALSGGTPRWDLSHLIDQVSDVKYNGHIRRQV
jgi:hypothetical protein